MYVGMQVRTHNIMHICMYIHTYVLYVQTEQFNMNKFLYNVHIQYTYVRIFAQADCILAIPVGWYLNAIDDLLFFLSPYPLEDLIST